MRILLNIFMFIFFFNSILNGGHSVRKPFRFNKEAVKKCETKREGDEGGIDSCICHHCWHSLDFEGRCMGSTDECVRYCKCPEPDRSLEETGD